jgi:hypothetical protein
MSRMLQSFFMNNSLLITYTLWPVYLVQYPVHKNGSLVQTVSHLAVAWYIRRALRHSVTVQLNVRMGKTSDLSDFEHGMIICARCTGSSISETATLLGFWRTTVSRVYREWCNKQNHQSVAVLWAKTACWRKMARIVQANRWATNRHITAQKGISERTTCRSLPQMGYSSRQPHWVPFLIS